MAVNEEKPSQQVVSLEGIVKEQGGDWEGQGPTLDPRASRQRAQDLQEQARSRSQKGPSTTRSTDETIDLKDVASDLGEVELDLLLASLDPGFQEAIADLDAPLAEDAAAQVGAAGEDEGGMGDGQDLNELLAATQLPWKTRYRIWRGRVFDGFKNLAFFIWAWSLEQIKLLPGRIKLAVSAAAHHYKRLRAWYRALTKWQVFLLSSLVALAGALFVVLRLIWGGSGLIHAPADYLISDFREVADEIIEYDESVTFEEYYSTLRLPEYIVLLEKLVVNLQPSASSTRNPMGTFQFYVEGTKRESAIELKYREKEFLDVIQRTIEGMKYDELRTLRGKQKLKINIRNELNNLLNHGRVRRIYLKHFITKP